MKKAPRHFYIAALLNPMNDRVCEFWPRAVLVVKGKAGEGIVEAVLSETQARSKYAEYMTPKNTTDFGQSVILPSFFDMHFHWVQEDVREMPKDSLLQWLEKYTFPTEARFADPKYSKHKARSFFKKLSRVGTLGGAVYSSIHENAVDAAMMEAKGDFVIGNVLMNMNSPEDLTQTDQDSLKLTRKLIQKYKTRYAFTPRFAITTAPEVMLKGSRLADQAGCFKQTHLSETKAEIDFVLSIYRKIPGFEKVRSYTELYQKVGMLGPRSLMGHGIHLSNAELLTLSKSKTAIIHCPTSNAPIREKGLGSGLFDFKKVESKKVRWALGSDIGGGPFLSMFDVMRSFVAQNHRAKIKGASYVRALYRATLAGAEILGYAKKTGNLVPKKDANFIVVKLESQPKSDAESLLEQIIEPHKKARGAYDQLPIFVSFRGKTLYKSM